VGIQDRDYTREKRLRWDERSGEMRLNELQAARPASRWPALAIAIGCAGVVAVAGWMWWRSQSSVAPGSASGQRIEPQAEVALEQQWVPVGPVLEGRVTAVTDGDSIKVELDSGPIEVRMHSIDAPERDQPGGAEAREALTRRLGNTAVALEPVEQDQYGRMIAVVYQGDANVNAWLVREGHAWVYRQYARDARYCEAELAARADRPGVWARPAAEQKAPWEWRAVKRGRRVGYSDYSEETLERCVAALGRRPEAVAPLPPADVPSASASDGAPGECRIKGNISGSGKIYHVPGTAAYGKTKIDEARGERWFCTEDEARDAGWRAPRQ
jgi:endonuclease YncB( thermonuclease family)